ncbi:hypothetical protein HZC09_01415 [Candidatus Micrarchaeota archaeon]|nr:hypothetical protein [Candidatus Micrarchaeota archaeon]
MNGARFVCPKVPAEKSVVFCTWGYSDEKQIKQGERYEHKLLERVFRVRNPGTLALGLAYVACGRYSGCVHNQAKPWDITAGNLMIEEAGGKVTDFNGKKWDPFMKTMVAGNALNHRALLEAVK